MPWTRRLTSTRWTRLCKTGLATSWKRFQSSLLTRTQLVRHSRSTRSSSNTCSPWSWLRAARPKTKTMRCWAKSLSVGCRAPLARRASSICMASVLILCPGTSYHSGTRLRGLHASVKASRRCFRKLTQTRCLLLTHREWAVSKSSSMIQTLSKWTAPQVTVSFRVAASLPPRTSALEVPEWTRIWGPRLEKCEKLRNCYDINLQGYYCHTFNVHFVKITKLQNSN